MNSLKVYKQAYGVKPRLNSQMKNKAPTINAIELIFSPPNLETKSAQNDSPFTCLKPRPAQERAREIVSHLEELILNPERLDGKTGISYRSWAKTARKEIKEAIQEAESSAAFQELISANRIGGLCLRIGFLILATVSSFAAFWYGILFIWQEHGAIWGTGATLSAVGLSIAFITAGLLFGSERQDDAKHKVMKKYID
jgi:hypothetical protein